MIRDSRAGIWNAMADGILDEDDVTASGRLRPSLDGNLPTPSPTNWARDVKRTTPFGMQNEPFSPMNTLPLCQTPPAPPAPTRPPLSPLAGNIEREHVHARIYKAELKWEEDKYPRQAVREGMLRRFVALAHEVEAMLESEAR